MLNYMITGELTDLWKFSYKFRYNIFVNILLPYGLGKKRSVFLDV